jgi:carbamoyl-phosphate synthase/aspartate carbamoyltransferase
MGKKTVMINYNPETVSTDYDEADRLYFENLTLERVLDIYELENSQGVVGCMGGQTPNNIALALHREKVHIFGTSPEMIDGAENRYKFSRMCDKIGVDQPEWKELTTLEEAPIFCASVGYPVLVRPSYVLSGAAMNVVYSEADLKTYLQMAVNVSRDYPVVISKFIDEAKEIELDAVAHNGKLVMHIISEHVENAGVHSGDATLILPPQDLDPSTVKKIEIATAKVVEALNINGPLNIQFIAKNNEIKIIECNVRASRSFPFCSKVLGCDLIELATKVMMGEEYEAYPVMENIDYVACKVPQFSFNRLAGADPILGVEMASTGEVACFGKDKYEAYIKALMATGFKLPKKNILISIGSFKEKQELLPSVIKLHQMGYKLFATSGTADFMSEHNIPLQYLEAMESEETSDQKLEYSLNQHLSNHLVDLYINLPSNNKFRRPGSYQSQGYRTRRMAVDFDIPLITNIKCAKLFVEALSRGTDFEIQSHDYFTSHKTMIIPGLVSVEKFSIDQLKTESAIKSGFTYLINEKELKSYVDYGLVDQYSYVENASGLELQERFKNGKKVICVAGEDLARVLLFANLHQKSVHISQVFRKQDLELILLARDQGLDVTFDTSVYHLFLSRSRYDYDFMASDEDQSFLWENIGSIDCFSVGDSLSKLSKSLGKEFMGEFEFVLKLLLTAVQDGRLTMDDIVKKFSENPRKILGLESKEDTFVEVIDTN